MHWLQRKPAIAGVIATLAAATLVAPAASAEVTYTPLYWQLLDRYASVEANWASTRGVYAEDPECVLAQQQGGPIACGQIIVIMNPDGSLGAAGGWRIQPPPTGGGRRLGTTAWIQTARWRGCAGD